MCGLVGIIGEGIIRADVKVLQQLIYVDSLRGHHSTGVAWVDKGGFVEHYKKALDGPDFLQLDRVKDVMITADDYPVIMAHNRFATKGGISTSTAHPFEHGDITLCHNGTLETQVGLPEHTKFAVDSENIAYAFAVDGAEVTIPKLKGAFALTWFDGGNNTFNMVRNEDRPLCLAINKSRAVTYYASERKMLEAILDRNKITGVDFLEVKTGKWVTWQLDGAKVGVPRIKDIEVYEKPDYVYQNYQNNYQRGLTTTPTSADILNGWRLKVGDKIEFYLTGVTPYSHNQLTGTGYGLMCEEPYLEVRTYGAATKLIAGYYEATVANGTKRGKEEFVVVNSLVLKEIIKDDANNHGREAEVEEALAAKK